MALFQGDGLTSLWVADLPSQKIAQARVMVVSNSCDMAPQNKQLLGPRILYCPIISLAKYEGLIKSLRHPDVPKAFQPSVHLDTIRKQRISTMFYLPKSNRMGEEAIALLDRINNCDAQKIEMKELIDGRLFTLSDYGFYLFLFKLSIHLTRIREAVTRS